MKYINVTTIALNGIQKGGGKAAKLQDKNFSITENGDTTIVPDEGFDGISGGTITTNVVTPTQNKSVEITTNGTTTITPDDGYKLDKVDITTDVHPTETINLNISKNGLYQKAGDFKNYVVNVNVNPNTQAKSIDINENGEIVVTPDDGYSYLNSVHITTNVPTGGIDMAYVGSFKSWKFTTEQFISMNTYNWDKVTSMKEKFGYCTNLTTFPLVDTSNVTNMQSTFNSCTNLSTISKLDTSNVTNMGHMFDSCYKLLEIPLLDTNKVTDMQYMFHYCDLTTIPQLDTSKVTTMYGMFRDCSNLLEIPLLNTSNVTNMQELFYYCTSLTTIPQLDTSNVTNVRSMFGNCSNLTDVPLLNFSNVTTDMTNAPMFLLCYKLTNLGGFQNLSVNLNLSYSPLLTVESLMNVINNLKNLTGGTAQTLTLGSTNLAKLTDDQKAIATGKNWVLS